MAQIPLAQYEISGDTHPDAALAIATVRSVLDAVHVAYLKPAAVTVDADLKYRGAYFWLPHSAEPGTQVHFRQGDGWFHLESPLGNFDGYLDDQVLGELVTAVLTGAFIRTSRLRGEHWVQQSWGWRDTEGRWQSLGRRVNWCAAWRLLLFRRDEQIQRHSLSFDRVPAVLPVE